jgi:hypothetical protein
MTDEELKQLKRAIPLWCIRRDEAIYSRDFERAAELDALVHETLDRLIAAQESKEASVEPNPQRP